MTIANCPRCYEPVRVPAGVSADATVQCPLCREEYSLAEPLAKLPPELLVVESFDAPPADDVDIEDSWDAIEAAPDEVKPASEFAFAPVVGDAKSAFDIEGGDSEGPSPASSVRASARRSKPKGSPVKSILSIAIGGLLAFPIAQLILWYLPGDLKRDFGAGPVVAKYLPAIVPTKFRGTTANAANDEDSVIPDFNAAGAGTFSFPGNDQDSQAGKQRQPSEGNTGFKLPDMEGTFSEPGDTETDNVVGTGSTADDVTGVELPGVEVEAPSISAPGVELPGVEVPGVEVPGLTLDPPADLTEEPALEPSTSPVASLKEPSGSPPAASATAVGSVKEAPVFKQAELADAFSKAATASADWDAAGESAVTGKQKAAFYRAMASLGEVLAYSDDQAEEPAEQRAETSRLLAEVARQAAKLDAIAAVESRWIGLSRTNRGSDGICIHGTVASVEQHGELFQTVVESNGWSVPVMTRDDPSVTIDVGRQVLVLGAIVTEPADRLVGYEGDAEVVILSGLHAALQQDTLEQE